MIPAVDSLRTLYTHRSAWLLAIRPKTLGAAIAPVLLGFSLAFAQGKSHGLAAFCALWSAVLIQIGTNFANDYYDYFKGADTAERLGPQRVTQSGLLPPEAVKHLFQWIFALSAGFGLYLVLRGGWPILVLGLVSIACGVLYTGGPFPLAYHGLGDAFVLIFFGPVAVGGTYFVQALELSSTAIFLGFVPGLTATALIAINNLRDAPTDAKVGKRTLAVQWGTDFVRKEIQVCLLLSVSFPVLLVAANLNLWPMLLGLLAFKPALEIIRPIRAGIEGRELNLLLAQTGKLLLMQALLVAVGLALSGWF